MKTFQNLSIPQAEPSGNTQAGNVEFLHGNDNSWGMNTAATNPAEPNPGTVQAGAGQFFLSLVGVFIVWIAALIKK